jgi:VanZ family protein
VHFVLFGVLSLLWLLGLRRHTIQTWILVLLGCIFFGYAVEVLQGLLHDLLGRSQDNMDALADGVGALLGGIAARAWIWSRRKKDTA